ncbi:A-kinase anchor protein 200 [Sitodiplosis mosellana]|uniref:A-kinase anchor protein 200 n=1 Tax=Sitodiplosis mosellana TaxID=263140 RepID=UPI002444DD46|nr:A-kinase anchor protein 200 [Sitodiplosis mosellana]XP_055295005.1 A-kinase anchor protein 200 [Sitodiplosis mosellana]XP_055295006.1 A-kinase anchor protein 200 [Sitodiplosis mosellana]XP_055295007.1 A-kinase anchor protein 200 [Sitodiplosis mosellana]XP_055295009.1 A-kinase anchor protein 200 [Sitodiplosis mosellana]XP_055295010.1 A-kinase anchor protein 200 [Sitodiplosis mosellana]
MGKAQSKRSVDITTENKEGVAIADGEAGKVGKIEEVDQKPQLNGEANKDADSGTAEKQEEKKDEGAENEKDAATEKTEQPAAEAESKADDATAAVAAVETKEEEKPAENGEGTENAADTTTGTLDESKDGVENAGDDATSTPVTDSAKKTKKEKSKKRFLSFRSFSFSKKDKTKPKKEEAAAATTNGECEKVPEEGTEEATAAATAVEPSGDEEKAVAAEPVTNGTTEEVKTNGEPAAPVATPEESVTPPSNGDSKPIVEAAKETVNEVIVAASKSVDEKLNAVAKPEVNKNADQDHLQEQTHTQALETNADNNESHEQSLSSESANIDTIPNQKNIVETIDEPKSVVVGDDDDVVVDCTNNSSNNDTDNINSQSSAPPLPDSPPPSQITVFAESAMSVDSNQVEIPQTIPVIETETKVQSVSALIGDAKIELALPESAAADVNAAAAVVVVVDDVVVVDESHVNETVTVEAKDEQLATSNETNEPQSETDTQIQTDNEPNVESQIEPELPKPDEEIAETIAILDRVNLNESDVKPTVESVATETINTEPLSADISSPLPQNSLDTLPSPQSLSSNVTPPNEIVDESAATVELSTEDASSLPPPPPIDDDIVALGKQTEQSGSNATAAAAADDDVTQTATQNGNDDLLPPPPAQELIDTEIIDELKTNGVTLAEQQIHSVEALNGDGNLNGSAKEHDEAANNVTDKATNGVATDNGVSEKLNGDHKPEEIATSPEKLEKLAAANPPPSTEVVAAE